MNKPAVRAIDTPYSLARTQIDAVLARLEISSTGEHLHPPWVALDQIIGPILPGTLTVIGARPGLGKTSLLANWFSASFRAGRPTLYIISGDGGPVRLRLALAAMHCGFVLPAVLRGYWHEASRIMGADEVKAAVSADIAQQEAWNSVGMVYEVPELTRDALREALKFGLRNGVRTVIVDHINRWTPSQARETTAELAGAVKGLVNVASSKGIAIILAAQITPWNKDARNALAELACPPLSALKQTQALVEEPHIILLLHKARRLDVSDADIRAASVGQKDAHDLVEPDLLCATCGKHRDDGQALWRTAKLRIDRTGWLSDVEPSRIAAKREREPGEDDLPLPF